MAREIPQYISQLNIGSMPQVQFSTAQGEATSRASAQLGAVAEDMQRKSNEIESLRVQTTLRENINRIYHESPNDPATIKAKADGFLKTYIPNIRNSELRQKLEITAPTEIQPYIDKATESYGKILDDDYKVTQLTALSRNNIAIGEAAKTLATATTPEAIKSSSELIARLTQESAQIASATDSKGFRLWTPEKSVSILHDGQRAILDALPADKRIQALGGSKGGWDEAAILIRKHEGGLNVNDGNTGNPAIFGINRKWHEKAFDEVKAVYDTQGFAAGQQAADAYLKERYWDKNGLDQLAPEQQGIVYDALINSGDESTFSKKLLAAAKAGAKPSELIDMRQQEYDRLAASGKYSKQDVASWNNRLADYQHLVLNEYTDTISESDKKKYLNESIAEFKAQEERANTERIMTSAVKDKEVFAKFTANEPNILQTIEDYKNNGGDPELANYMRTSALTRNKLSSGEQDQYYTDIIDRVNALQITTKEGKVKIGKDDATLEDVVRLQKDIMAASIKGVTGLDSQLKKISPALMALAEKETGYDDKGVDSFFGFFRSTEAYDTGYTSIQNYLEGQGKEKDLATKSSMMREFINRADQIPEDIQKDDLLFKQAQEKIASFVIASEMQKGMKNIPTTAISRLLANPSEAGQFDEIFGAGASNRILGK